MLRQLQKSSKTILIEHSTFIIFANFEVLLDSFVNFRRESIDYLTQSFVNIALLSVLEIFKFRIPRYKICVKELYSFQL
jgi:hypothetical protein